MYLISLDGRLYERKGGGTFTLIEAMQEAYGCAGITIYRDDAALTPVVRNAGSATEVEYAPTERRIRRRARRYPVKPASPWQR